MKLKSLTIIAFISILTSLVMPLHAEDASAINSNNVGMNVSANVRLSIDTGKEISLVAFFQKVESSSNYLFQFKDKDVANVSVNLKLEDVTINQLMDKALEGTNLTYTVSQRYVVIESRPAVIKDDVKPEGLTVHGIVSDSNGSPLPGVFVLDSSSSTNGVTTDLDGSYSIMLKNPKSSLIFSCLGFKDQTVAVSGRSDINVTLSEDNELLEEVVVVGYGVQKKVNLTGSVATASGDVLSERPIANVAQGLQGVIPNLNITFNSGQPDAPAQVNIRGNTSLNGGNALILLDGVEISDISLVNPQDIENISVLKDASAAAVYGARAAFGVMLITTKKGAADKKPQVNYNNNLSWSTPARIKYMKMPRADKWARMWNLACEYEGKQPWFTDKYLEYLDNYIADPENNPDVFVDTEGIHSPAYNAKNPGWGYCSNTDWFDAFYKDAGFMHQHNASITGGGKHASYYASIGYKDQDGIFRYGNDSYERLNATLSVDVNLAKWLDLGFSTRINYSKKDVPNVSLPFADSPSVYYEIYRMHPTVPLFLPNGDWAAMKSSHNNFNIIGRMANAGRDLTNTWDNWYTFRFDLHPIEGLSIKGDYSYNTFFSKRKVHDRTFEQIYPEGREPDVICTPNGVSNYHINNIYQAFNIWGEYRHTFADMHNMSVMLGYNQEQKTYYKNTLTMSNLIDNDLPVTDMALEYRKNSEVNTLWRVQGAFFRLNYDYDSRYLVEVNGRYDGSSKYAKADRWAFFPSASIGWNIAREPFMEKSKSFLDELKLRYSMGVLGNQVTDGFHDYMSIIETVPLNNYIFGNKLANGLTTPTIPSLVTWEKVVTYDLGLDWSFLQSRLTGSFDWYIRDTKGMVRTVTLPSTFGTASGKENLADMRTMGWEFEINWRDRVNDVLGSPFDYGVGIGLSDYQATITKYDNPSGILTDFYEGMKLGEIWGYQTQGFIKTQDEADYMNEVQQNLGSKWYPGDIRYTDLDKDGYITVGTNTLDNHGDLKIIGNSTPRYRFNLTGNIGWHGFNIDLAFEGVMKRDVWISSDVFWGFARDIYNSSVMEWHMDKVWTEDNTDAYFPRLMFSGNRKSKQIQSKYIQNAAYIRLKNLTFSYDLPEKWLEKIKIAKARIYVAGLNVWEATGLPPFMTPDIVDNISSRNIASENSGKEYTFMRSWSLGLNITF